MARAQGIKQIAQNRKAFHDYFVLERFEAGIELFGTEVKSIRAGTVNLKDSFCTVKDGELFARGLHISPYEKGNIFNRDPMRPKRLLMHKREIMKLNARVMQEGVALIPVAMAGVKAQALISMAASSSANHFLILLLIVFPPSRFQAASFQTELPHPFRSYTIDGPPMRFLSSD